MASMVLEFGGQSGDSLPPSIASFANPVHVDSGSFAIDVEALVGDSAGFEWHDTDVVGPTSDSEAPFGQSSSQASASGQPSSAQENIE